MQKVKLIDDSNWIEFMWNVYVWESIIEIPFKCLEIIQSKWKECATPNHQIRKMSATFTINAFCLYIGLAHSSSTESKTLTGGKN